MENNAINWKRMRFKRNKVWLAVDRSGNPLQKDGKFLIKYQLEQDYEYWVKPENVVSLDRAEPVKNQLRQKSPNHRPSARINDQQAIEDLPTDAIIIYTDGASSGNPGPSGIGVVLQYGGHCKEISRYIGTATNNIAELKAILTALDQLKQTELPVRILTDSSYALGLLTLGWKPKKNVALVEKIKRKMKTFKDLKLIKVKGHANLPGNERADRLATSAISGRNGRN
jgi:ribonuclease HI